MPKKITNCFKNKLTFENLLKAHYRARRHKMYKNEVIRFEMNLENNIWNLERSILNKTYHVGTYREFRIYEPKERIIKALPYIDRVVHQWYIEEFIKPYILPRFVSTSFACLENRGTHKAVDKVQEYMREFYRSQGDFWILKCDIRKYFYNIDPQILMTILQKYIRDNYLLDFTRLLIYDGRKSDESVGIPIGNYTSQFFANIYLNELDQFLKRTKHVKYYVRYMDDFVLLFKTKAECIEYKKIISDFIAEHLHLELNSKSRYYPYKMGVNFCGYRIYTTHRLLRTSSKKKIISNVKKWNAEKLNGTLNYWHALQSINSWLGHASHCNSYNFRNKIFNSCNFLINQHYTENIEYNLIQDEQDFKNGILF